MLKAVSGRLVRAVVKRIMQPQFWAWLTGIGVLTLVIGGLLMFAVSRHDAFLRLRPVICDEGMADRQFFIVAVASPICILLTLAAIGEFWLQLDQRRAGEPMRWGYLLLFLGLALGLAVLILSALRC